MRAGLSLRLARALPLGMVQDFATCYLIADCGWSPSRPKASGSLFDQMIQYYGR